MTNLEAPACQARRFGHFPSAIVDGNLQILCNAFGAMIAIRRNGIPMCDGVDRNHDRRGLLAEIRNELNPDRPISPRLPALSTALMQPM
jgi:hypothetical protein